MSDATAAVKKVSVHEAAQLRKEKPPTDWLHIDVRNRDEWEADGIIPGTVRIPLAVLDAAHLPADQKDKHLLFSCRSGGRSMKAALQAVSLGYTNVYNVEGGYTAWRESGSLPVAKLEHHQPFVKCFYDAATGTCQYVVSDEESKDCAIVDPVLDYDAQACRITHANVDKLCEYVRHRGLRVTHILETHAHADHLTAAQVLKQKLGARVCIGRGIVQVQQTFANVFDLADGDILPSGGDFDVLLDHQSTFNIGTLVGKALAVPGHTPDHLCYVIGDSAFVGDTIFMPDSGSARCDFPGGSAEALFKSIHQILYSLPDSTRVFVGHDYAPNGRKVLFESTIAEQKAANTHAAEKVTMPQFVTMRQDRDKTLSNPKLLFPSLQVNIRAGKMPARTATNGKVIFSIPVSVPLPE